MGMANARVLPEPVRDLARTSRPARASAMTRAWMGNGVVIPRTASAFATRADTPRSGKDCVDMLFPPAALMAAERSGEVSLSAEPSVSGGTAEAKPHGAKVLAREARIPGGEAFSGSELRSGRGGP